MCWLLGLLAVVERSAVAGAAVVVVDAAAAAAVWLVDIHPIKIKIKENLGSRWQASLMCFEILSGITFDERLEACTGGAAVV